MPKADETTFPGPLIGVGYRASDMIGRGHCMLSLGGFSVWMGRIAEVPPDQRFDHITMHPDDIADMEDAARAKRT